MSFRYAIPPHATIRTSERYKSIQFTFTQEVVRGQGASSTAADGSAHYESFRAAVGRLLQVEALWIGERLVPVSETPAKGSPLAAAPAAPRTGSESGVFPAGNDPVTTRPDQAGTLLPPSSTRAMSIVSGSSGSSASGMTSGDSTTTTAVSEYGTGTADLRSPVVAGSQGEEAIMDALEVLSFSDESTMPSSAVPSAAHLLSSPTDEATSVIVEDFLSESVVIGASDPYLLPPYQAAFRAHSRLSTVSSTASSAASAVESVASASSTAKPVRRHQKLTHKLSRVVDRVSDHLSSSSRSRKSDSSRPSSASSATGSKRHSELFRESLASKRDSLLDRYAEL